MSATVLEKARYFREQMRKGGAPLTLEALTNNVAMHVTIAELGSVDGVIGSAIKSDCVQAMRDRDMLGRVFYPCEWSADGRIVEWKHRDEITLSGWERNLDERLQQEVGDKKARRRVAIIIEVLSAAKADAGHEVSFADCEHEIARRWQKAKVAP